MAFFADDRGDAALPGGNSNLASLVVEGALVHATGQKIIVYASKLTGLIQAFGARELLRSR
ncbi:MAG: hypothetical protein ACREM8_00665 [Vulcanimicrobiaceae bacterium]